MPVIDETHFDFGKVIAYGVAVLAMNAAFYYVVAYTQTKDAVSTRDISDLIIGVGGSNVALAAVFCSAKWIVNVFKKLTGADKMDVPGGPDNVPKG
jgi:hypothetical protein